VRSIRSHTDWWTWINEPTDNDSDKQLALDPACNSSHRPHVVDMVALATKRRAGQHPAYTRTWGAAIGALPNLKMLELILETFLVKEHQLNTVVECAKLWRFPLKDTQYELVCDGNVESMKWENPADDDNEGCTTDSEAGSKTIDLDNDNSFPGVQNEAHNSFHKTDCNEQNEFSHSQLEAPFPLATTHTSQERESVSSLQEELVPINSGPSLLEDGVLSPYEGPVSPQWAPTSPTYTLQSGFSSPIYNSSSPAYSPARSAGSLSPFSENPWLRTATEFCVRIVCFKRRKAD